MRRVGFAILLVLAAVALPTIAWYVVGSRDAANEAKRLEGEALSDATDASQRLATVLTARLEGVRETENRRPYFHYQNLYHDPRGAYVGASVQLSPLAEGNFDPLVHGHFQIDSQMRVSMPTINPEVPELNTASAPTSVALLEALKKRSRDIVSAARDRDLMLARLVLETTTHKVKVGTNNSDSAQTESVSNPNVETVSTEPTVTPTQVAMNQGVKNANPKNARTRYSQVQRLEPQQWAYNQQANSVYTEIKDKSGLPVAQQQAEVLDNINNPPANIDESTPTPTPTPIRKVTQQAKTKFTKKEVIIEVGTLEWHTIELDGRPRLAALRLVKTPAGEITQGFVVDDEAVSTLLNNGAFPAHLVPGAPEDSLETPLGFDGAEWSVVVDAEHALSMANEAARTVEAQFRGTFAFGALVALIAGFALVVLVWKSEELAAQRSHFAAAAAHELRTPLAGIRMYGEMLSEGMGDPQRSKDYARRVASEADRLGRIVKNVLGFTRLEQGNLSVSPAEGDLAQTVRTIVEQHQPALDRSGMQLNVEIPGAPVMSTFDRDAVSQILQNLLDNAEKYTREVEDRRLDIEMRVEEPWARIRIRDYGFGIGAKVRRRIFRAFSRGGESDAPAGLGLGLSLAKGLAEAQEGRLDYAEPAGAGAEFVVSLPLAG